MESCKRFRPTVTAYRALEKEIEGHLEDKSRLVSDCDGWREKYRDAMRHVDEVETENARLKDEASRMTDDISHLKSRISIYDNTLKEMLREKEELQQRVDELSYRGFWSRLFNK